MRIAAVKFILLILIIAPSPNPLTAAAPTRASATSEDRSSIRRHIERRPEDLWLTPLIGQNLPSKSVLDARLEAVKAYENAKLPRARILGWEFPDEGRRSGHRGTIAVTPVLKTFDQPFQFVATQNAIIHRPDSPDSLNRPARVYLFNGPRLTKVLSLDEWIISNFKARFGNKTVWYRTMSLEEAQLYQNRDMEKLKSEMVRRHKSGRRTYSSKYPALHFSAEAPINWTTKQDQLLRFEIDANMLIRLIKNDQARVGLYGNMLELQVLSTAPLEVLRNFRVVPPADIERMTPRQIESYLLRIDRSN